MLLSSDPPAVSSSILLTFSRMRLSGSLLQMPPSARQYTARDTVTMPG